MEALNVVKCHDCDCLEEVNDEKGHDWLCCWNRFQAFVVDPEEERRCEDFHPKEEVREQYRLYFGKYWKKVSDS